MAVSKYILLVAIFSLAIASVFADELVQEEAQPVEVEDLQGAEFLLEKLIHKLIYKHEKKAYKHGGYGYDNYGYGGYSSYGGYGGYYAPAYGGYRGYAAPYYRR